MGYLRSVELNIFTGFDLVQTFLFLRVLVSMNVRSLEKEKEKVLATC